MKHLLLTTIAAVVLVGCGESQPPEPPKGKAPDISIHRAAMTGNIEAVKKHITAGTDVNAKGGDGSTPLHLAAFRSYTEVVELLVAAGADLNAKDAWGRTPVDFHSTKRRKETISLLRKHGGKSGASDSIHVAAHLVNIEAVKQHLETCADVDVKDGRMVGTLLHYAENKKVADLLIAKGADVNAKGGRVGGTPLHNAALEGHNEVAALLIDKGADVNANDGFGKTPLDRSIERRIQPPPLDGHKLDSDIIQSLLRKHGGKTAEELKAEGK